MKIIKNLKRKKKYIYIYMIRITENTLKFKKLQISPGLAARCGATRCRTTKLMLVNRGSLSARSFACPGEQAGRFQPVPQQTPVTAMASIQ